MDSTMLTLSILTTIYDDIIAYIQEWLKYSN